MANIIQGFTKEDLQIKLIQAQELVNKCELETAFSLLTEVEEIVTKSDYLSNLEVDTLAEFGKLYWRKGEFKLANKYLDKAIKKGRSNNYYHGLAYALNYRANIEWAMGKFTNAKTLYSESFNLRQRIGDKEGISTSILNLGLISVELGDLDKAIENFEEAITLSRKIKTIGATSTLIIALNNLAEMHVWYGDLDLARPLLFEARDLSHKIDKQDGETWCIQNLGLLSWARGDIEPARNMLEESLDRWKKLGIKDRNYIENLVKLAGVLIDLEKYEPATLLLERAQCDAKALESEFISLYISYYFGYLEKSRGNYANADEFFRTCLISAKDQGNFEYTVKSLVELAYQALLEYKRLLDDESFDTAQKLIQDLFETASHHKMVPIQTEAKILQGMLMSSVMDYDQAFSTFTEALQLSKTKKLPKQTEFIQHQIEKIKLLKNRAQKYVQTQSQEDQITEIQAYLKKFSHTLKAIQT